MSTYYRADGWVLEPLGPAVAGASVAVLTDPSDFSAQPGSPLASIYGASTSNSATVTAASWNAQQIVFTLNTVPGDLVPGSYIATFGSVTKWLQLDFKRSVARFGRKRQSGDGPSLHEPRHVG